MAIERSLGATTTNELAIMWDTFRPLKLTALWREHDDPGYAYSWNPDREAGARADAGGAVGAEAVTVTAPPA